MNGVAILEKKAGRVFLFDELRGLMSLSMLLYHLTYDLVVLFGVELNWFFTPGTNLWQASTCCTFIFVSGACCRYSKSNYKRGLRLLLLACGFSLVTGLVAPDLLIAFGLLHFLAVSILLFPFLQKPLSHLPPKSALIGAVLLFFLTYQISAGRLGFGSFSVTLPRVLYSTPFLFPLGFCRSDFVSSDYFPLFPYFFLFLAGSILGECNLPDWVYREHSHWLGWLGKRSLWIYLVHQPVLIGLLWMIFRASAYLN